jgi:hypothetical protein
MAEALERQSLFVNRVVASHALALLFDLVGRGSIGHAGAFINIATGQAVPIRYRSLLESSVEPEAGHGRKGRERAV